VHFTRGPRTSASTRFVSVAPAAWSAERWPGSSAEVGAGWLAGGVDAPRWMVHVKLRARTPAFAPCYAPLDAPWTKWPRFPPGTRAVARRKPYVGRAPCGRRGGEG